MQAYRNGLIIEAIPFIEIVPREDDTLKAEVADLKKRPVTAVFTSRHSVLQVKAMPGEMPDWQIACLEGNTQEEAAACFGEEAIKWTAPDAATLATRIITADADSVVFFCGDKRLDHFPGALRDANKSCREIIVYETRLLPLKIQKEYDGIMFFSPSAAESFFAENELSEHSLLFAIGQTTARSLEKYSDNKIFISPGHNAETMIDQIIACFNDKE